ncbi:MAG: hypothetical protein JWQ09_508 [Segetibacter sp.]|nr:hypothetical protein [Segetibacter sp.]
MERKIKTKQKCRCGKFAFLVSKEDVPKEFKTKKLSHYDMQRVYHCKYCNTYSFIILPRKILKKKT